jgi:hypothetical protein
LAADLDDHAARPAQDLFLMVQLTHKPSRFVA